MSDGTHNAGNGRATWAVLGTWAGVILALVFGIGGVVGYSIDKKIEAIDVEVDGLRDRELAAALAAIPEAEERGVYRERVDALKAGLAQFALDIQREMRDLDAAMLARIIENDNQLQGEIDRNTTLSIEARQAMQKLLEVVQAYQDRSRELNSSQTEMIRALERAVYRDGKEAP